MKYKKLREEQKVPTGLKLVITYLILNIIGIMVVLFLGKYLGKSYNPVYLIIQLICYSLLLIGIIKLNNSARIATIIFLIFILTIRIFYFKDYNGIIWSFIFSGSVIYYLTKSEVESLFTKKYAHR